MVGNSIPRTALFTSRHWLLLEALRETLLLLLDIIYVASSRYILMHKNKMKIEVLVE